MDDTVSLQRQQIIDTVLKKVAAATGIKFPENAVLVSTHALPPRRENYSANERFARQPRGEGSVHGGSVHGGNAYAGAVHSPDYQVSPNPARTLPIFLPPPTIFHWQSSPFPLFSLTSSAQEGAQRARRQRVCRQCNKRYRIIFASVAKHFGFR